MIVAICLFSLCVNGIFVARAWSQRAADFRGMDMFPYYLAMAYVSYNVEFNRKQYPGVHSSPGRPAMDEAFGALQASLPLYAKYGYRMGSVYEWMYNLEFVAPSDSTAYDELSSIKAFLPLKTYIRPSKIQPLFDAITSEYAKAQHKNRATS